MASPNPQGEALVTLAEQLLENARAFASNGANQGARIQALAEAKKLVSELQGEREVIFQPLEYTSATYGLQLML